MSNTPWEFEQPLCAEVGVEVFYIEDRDDPEKRSGVRADYDSAKRVCNFCLHKTDCAEWGIRNEIHGVWGGLTPQERSEIRKRRKIIITALVVQI